ncbi:hypothetical protein [Brevundimonas lenta]|uniref:Lipoprotein n=1 Tax=Brevundimonas lenta TaxID=424796 RepID=A0A7W6JF51_9CAUL|nr:hypothetical protein [Brevundimonas lenta]MBB4083936.1 hypothetical protein [Brevundimonas lenta]
MKSFVVVAAVLTLTPLVSACAMLDQFNPQPEVAAASDMPGLLEPIHAAAIGQDQAVFWVSSNGCTEKADLTPVVRRAGDASVITLRRIKEDRCSDVRPEGVEMRWSFQELGLESGARVSVENPYQMPQT